MRYGFFNSLLEHRRIVAEMFDIVDIFVSRKPPEHGLPEQPTSAWRPFLPVRASASVPPAITLRPRASSSSRSASKPASDVTTDLETGAAIGGQVEPERTID
jgi:hypothetical protein